MFIHRFRFDGSIIYYSFLAKYDNVPPLSGFKFYLQPVYEALKLSEANANIDSLLKSSDLSTIKTLSAFIKSDVKTARWAAFAFAQLSLHAPLHRAVKEVTEANLNEKPKDPVPDSTKYGRNVLFEMDGVSIATILIRNSLPSNK